MTAPRAKAVPSVDDRPDAAGIGEPLPVDVVIPAWGHYRVPARRAMASAPDVARHVVVTDQATCEQGFSGQGVSEQRSPEQAVSEQGVPGRAVSGPAAGERGVVGREGTRRRATDADVAVPAFADVPLTLVARPEGGLGAARNAGLNHCDAEFVVFLDADDAMIPGALAALVRRARERPDADVFFGRFRRSNGELWPSARAARLMPTPAALPLLLSGNTLPMTGTLLRRSAVPGDLFPSVRSEDWAAAVRMRARSRVVFLDQAVLEYTADLGSRSRSRIARAEIVATRAELLPAVVRERGAPGFWSVVDRIADRRRRRLDADLSTYDDVPAGPGAVGAQRAPQPGR